MTGIMTATIETLTAEVRVLMVGSRQITLSVARQLDRAYYHEIEPMGRIKIDKDQQHVIGKLVSDGTLVVCEMPPRALARFVLLSDMLSTQAGVISMCEFDSHLVRRAFHDPYPGYRECDGDLLQRNLFDLCKSPLREHDRDAENSIVLCRRPSVPRVFLEDWEHYKRQHKEANRLTQERFRQANALPLIVLAGIK